MHTRQPWSKAVSESLLWDRYRQPCLLCPTCSCITASAAVVFLCLCDLRVPLLFCRVVPHTLTTWGCLCSRARAWPSCSSLPMPMAHLMHGAWGLVPPFICTHACQVQACTLGGGMMLVAAVFCWLCCACCLEIAAQAAGHEDCFCSASIHLHTICCCHVWRPAALLAARDPSLSLPLSLSLQVPPHCPGC